MNHRAFSDVCLSDLGPATGLFILGFRACAFGKADCCCVQSGFHAGLGNDAHETLADILLFTRVLSSDGVRKMGLSVPGCGSMTRDEVSIASAFMAAQAWDGAALEAHLSWLLGGPVSLALKELMIKIADMFAGHGLGSRLIQL